MGQKSVRIAVSNGKGFFYAGSPDTSAAVSYGAGSGEQSSINHIRRGFYRYYIFRDDVLVYKMDAPGVWEDFTACGAHTYWVRGVTKNDAFFGF